MNKYQSAYRFIELCVEPWQIIGNDDKPVRNTQRWDCMNILKELVDKATPRNVHNCSVMANTTNVWLCPVCKGFVSKDDNYCSKCGQRIEWK